MSTVFSFPTFAQMYPHEKRFLKRLRESLRYIGRITLCYRQAKMLEAFLNQHPLWADLFNQHLYRVNTLLYVYCDKNFSAQQRLDAITQHFVLAQQKLGTMFCKQLITQKSIVLSYLTENLSLKLNINDIDPLEGFFSLNIQDNETGQSLYDASFTFLAPDQLLIASMQGPKGENAQDLVRAATKQLHGVRPMFMLVNAFKIFAQTLNCELIGIPHKQQAKYRWNDSARLLFNYDEFWQENQAQLAQYWQIPTEIERKPLEEIQSKKRSMYRKRYDMFDKVLLDIQSGY
ncbi:VirK/YbjX family protein [Pasteurella oralis]|uniref:VirK/YbjX family protein n=1 Tax=Pasteurella oralis TaxID=1071947 RepID=A0ABW4NV58_9PAST